MLRVRLAVRVSHFCWPWLAFLGLVGLVSALRLGFIAGVESRIGDYS